MRFIEPVKGNEAALDLNILFNEQRENALKNAPKNKNIILTPPLDLVQGDKAIIAYAPIKIKKQFVGFIAGIFSTDEFFGEIISSEISRNYNVYLAYEGRNFFTRIAAVNILP